LDGAPLREVPEGWTDLVSGTPVRPWSIVGGELRSLS
jgi:hypothetical protein